MLQALCPSSTPPPSLVAGGRNTSSFLSNARSALKVASPLFATRYEAVTLKIS